MTKPPEGPRVDSSSWTGLDPEVAEAAQFRAVAERAAQEAEYSRWQRFYREVPELRSGLTAIVVGLVAATGWTLLLLISGIALNTGQPSPIEPVVSFLASIFPMIDNIPADLTARGYAWRAPGVRHLLGYQWLIGASSFVIAAVLLWPARNRLRSAYAKLRAVPGRVDPNGVAAFFAITALCMPLLTTCGHSEHDGRRFSYDLGQDGLALLLFPFPITLFWLTVYVFAAYALGLAFGRRQQLKKLF